MILSSGRFSYGLLISIGSGVINLEGFISSYVGEVFLVASQEPDAERLGLVVNLFRDQTLNLLVGALLVVPTIRVSEGCKVFALSRLASLSIGDFVIGSLLDPLGNCILNSKRVDADYRWIIEAPSPGIIERESVFEPLQTGLLSIDSMVPIGRGQRELLVGDRQTGKTAIGVDTILNQKYENVFSLYLPIGQKSAAILEVFISLIRRDTIANLSIVVASACSSALAQFLCLIQGQLYQNFSC
jgi:F-type H+-transporting ATPase subunit alpha